MASSDDNNAGMSGVSSMNDSSRPSTGTAAPNRKSERGFASMDPARQRAIASQGGKAAHQSGNAHEFTSEEAREAGRKGGHASHSNRRAAAAASRNQSSPS